MFFSKKIRSASQYEQSCSSNSSSTMGNVPEILNEDRFEHENDYGNDNKIHYYTPNKPTLGNNKSYSLRKLSSN